MFELNYEEISVVSGAINWEQAGNALAAFSGFAAITGNAPAAVVLGIGAIICYSI